MRKLVLILYVLSIFFVTVGIVLAVPSVQKEFGSIPTIICSSGTIVSGEEAEQEEPSYSPYPFVMILVGVITLVSAHLYAKR